MNYAKAILFTALSTLTLPTLATPTKNVNAGTRGIAHAFGLNANHNFKADDVLAAIAADINGLNKIKLRQYYRGIEVYGTHVVGISKNTGPVLAVSGQVAEFADMTVTATISKATAIKTLQRAFGAKRIGQVNIRLVIDARSALLAYQVDFIDLDRVSRPSALINAHSGAIIHAHEGITHAKGGGKGTATAARGPGGNDKTGLYYYGTDFDTLEVTENSGNCTLENERVKVIDMNHETSVPRKAGAFSFTCSENSYKAINGAYAPLNDAHFFAETVVDMYQNTYGVTPLDRKVEIRVHYGSNYQNAFWDGQAVSFGDGGSLFYPLVSLDLMAHEVSHGLTEQHSGLVYYGESGALNESFSDMAGEVAENRLYGSNDWMVAAQVYKGTGAPRYMNDPSKDNRSIVDASQMTDNLGVHYGSGIYNRAFYLLSNSSGWDINSAFAVMLRANRLYWTPYSTFNSAACGTETAAADLGMNVDDVSNVLAQVGVVCQ